jgi:hypothetical protein
MSPVEPPLISADSATRPHILVISYSDLTQDARVRRHLEALRGNFSLTTAALAPSGLEGIAHIALTSGDAHVQLPWLLRKIASAHIRLRRYLLKHLLNDYNKFYWDEVMLDALSRLRHLRPDVIIANEIEALPLAIALAAGRSNVAWVRQFQAYNTYLCRTYMPKADACFTVSKGIAEAYHELTGVMPDVLVNAPAFEDLSPGPLAAGRIRLVHHGNANRHRRIEDLISMMDGLEDSYEFHLYLMPADTPEYMASIQAMCAERSFVHLHKPIPPEHIARTINQYDIGVHHLHTESFNHLHALPNKFFDFVQARLAVAISPNPAMAALTVEHDLGVVAADHHHSSLREAILSLDRARIMTCKLNAHHSAQTLSSRTGNALLCSTVERLLRDAK